MRSAHAISRPSLEAKDYARLSLCGVASIEQSQMEAGQGREGVGWAVSQKKGYTAGAGSQRLKPATRRRRSRRQHANSPQEPAGHWQHAAGAATIIPLWPCNPFVSTVSTLGTVLLLVQCACRTSCHCGCGCECSTWCGRRSICRFRVSFLFLFLFSV